MRVQTPASDSKLHFVSSQNFPNGTQLSLVRESVASEPRLLFWDGAAAATAASFDIGGHSYEPLRLTPSVLKNLRLPASPVPYGSLEEIVAGLTAIFQQRACLQEEVARLLVYCGIATWFSDVLDLAPCLCITSPAGRDRVLILKLLSYFCRHALLLGQASAESVLHVAPGLNPTLLIHYSKVPAKVQGLINVGCYRGTPVPSAAGEMFDVFGMKVMAASEMPISLENVVNVAIPPHRTDPSPRWDDGLEQLASQLQGQLLRYRLEHCNEVLACDWDVPEFVSPVREIARSLGRCLCSAKLRDDLIDLLREQEEYVRAAWSADEHAIALEALLLACHDPEQGDAAANSNHLQGTRLYVGEAAEIANGVLQSRGEPPWFSARGIGETLRAVGLLTRRLDRAGRGWKLNRKTREKIHELAKSYGVRSLAQAFPGCAQCKMFVGLPAALNDARDARHAH
jgi:hypothetical protein